MSKKALEGGGILLRRVNDGDKAVVVFRGDPCAARFTGPARGTQTARVAAMSIVRPGTVDPCVCLNVYAVKDGSMQTMESGVTWFIDIVKVRNKYGSDKYAFEIERHGPPGTPKTVYDLP